MHLTLSQFFEQARKHKQRTEDGPRHFGRLIGRPTEPLEQPSLGRFLQGGAEQFPFELMQLRMRPVNRPGTAPGPRRYLTVDNNVI
jgi:hypothetical protein